MYIHTPYVVGVTVVRIMLTRTENELPGAENSAKSGYGLACVSISTCECIFRLSIRSSSATVLTALQR